MTKNKLFGGEDELRYNALHEALIGCTKDYLNIPEDEEVTEGSMVYKYLHTMPKTSLICELVDKLNELGYEIVKK